jgi:hypothetical protein
MTTLANAKCEHFSSSMLSSTTRNRLLVAGTAGTVCMVGWYLLSRNPHANATCLFRGHAYEFDRPVKQSAPFRVGDAGLIAALIQMFTAGWFGGDSIYAELALVRCKVCGFETEYYREAITGAHVTLPHGWTRNGGRFKWPALLRAS